MTRIAIDVSPIKTGEVVRGVGVYTKNLVVALRKEARQLVDVEILEGRRGDVNLLHVPYFEPYFLTLPLFSRVPVVVTIHDAVRLIYKERYPPGIKGSLRFLAQKVALGQVAGVLTDSECSRKDIVRFLGVLQGKIFVVRLAAGEAFRVLRSKEGWERVRRKYGLPDDFVLYVGDVDWNKNVLGLVEAVKLAGVKLVIVGKQAVSRDFDRYHIEMQPLVELQGRYGEDEDVIRVGFVPEEDLVRIYNLATVYCQPSFYEGFGMPVLEAMACGCPVVASRRASLVEVGGGAVEWIEPEDVGGMAKVIERVMRDRDLRRRLREEGLERVKSFSWGQTARQTLEVYLKILGERR